ncbi:VRR-NUC domain-containing protein, partial [Streptococcus suis]
GRVRPEQEKFIDRMQKFGALAGVARSVEDAMDIVGGKANGTI